MVKEYKTRKWTLAAKECYEFEGECEDCSVFSVLGGNCKMKETVQMLLKRDGEPPEHFQTHFKLKRKYNSKESRREQ